MGSGNENHSTVIKYFISDDDGNDNDDIGSN